MAAMADPIHPIPSCRGMRENRTEAHRIRKNPVHLGCCVMMMTDDDDDWWIMCLWERGGEIYKESSHILCFSFTIQPSASTSALAFHTHHTHQAFLFSPPTNTNPIQSEKKKNSLPFTPKSNQSRWRSSPLQQLLSSPPSLTPLQLSSKLVTRYQSKSTSSVLPERISSNISLRTIAYRQSVKTILFLFLFPPRSPFPHILSQFFCWGEDRLTKQIKQTSQPPEYLQNPCYPVRVYRSFSRERR